MSTEKEITITVSHKLAYLLSDAAIYRSVELKKRISQCANEIFFPAAEDAKLLAGFGEYLREKLEKGQQP